MTPNEMQEFLDEHNFTNLHIMDAFLKANNVIGRHQKVACSLSGGADSDIMLDILSKVDSNNKVNYMWFNTGLEYQATKDHLKELEEKYNITINRLWAEKPIPLACKQYGQPFLSKYVSRMINALQKHNFKWEDKPFEDLIKEYPKCSTYIKWWCNKYYHGAKGHFNINYNKWLKEFLIANPPTFPISDKCCTYAKKNTAKMWEKANDVDLKCIGIRKAEGGIRATIQNCYTPSEDGIDTFRPIFWITDKDKKEYEELFNIEHSDCYKVWGMKRTGCAVCPFGKDFEFELECIQKYEPKLYKAVNNIFGQSYEYTRKYREFYKQMNEQEKLNKNS